MAIFELPQSRPYSAGPPMLATNWAGVWDRRARLRYDSRP